jgi:hypothetical protein
MSQSNYIVCTSCEKGILTVVAEVGIEAEEDPTKFQSLSAAHGRIYKCDLCGKSFVTVDDKFLELK